MVSIHPGTNDMITTIEAFLQSIEGLGGWAYVFIALLVAFEGPVVTLFGAVAASAQYLKPVPVFVSAAVGNMAADLVWYSLGYLGKLSWVERLVGAFGIKKQKIKRFEQAMQNQAGRFIFFSKLTLGLMIPALLATGLTRIPFKRWFPPLLVGEMIWTGILMAAGLWFGEFIQSLERGVQVFALGGSVLLVFFVARYLIRFQPSIQTTDDHDEVE